MITGITLNIISNNGRYSKDKSQWSQWS